MPKCTINGKEVEVNVGQTIMEAFQKCGEQIAYYCWHPGLKVAGVCRMCMVEIEGNPKLQIACNTPVVEGMKVTNKTEKVKEAVKWTLDFHLINHPLDCPICDQAGECGLQEFYMAYGKYDPEMGQPKVKKQKVIDLGPQVVLDSERCILCSRCVRFTSDVTKTNELGIFNRGDHAEIGCVDGHPLDNKYSVNTVDICPVGALTAKDFRFKQRVWYLEEFNTTCNGCSTGCSVKVYYNQHGTWRVKPNHSEEVNGWWMCDEGREVYKFVNPEFRQKKARLGKGAVTQIVGATQAVQKLSEHLKVVSKKSGPDSVALILTGQYTVEEYKAIVPWFKKNFGDGIYHWKNDEKSFDTFDGLLIRGDKNPNTKGLEKVLKENGIESSWGDLEAGLKNSKIKTAIVAGPENQSVYTDLAEKVALFSRAEIVWLTSCKNLEFDKVDWVVPMKSYAEKNGTFINYDGLERKVRAGVDFVPEALTLSEVVALCESPSRTAQMEA